MTINRGTIIIEGGFWLEEFRADDELRNNQDKPLNFESFADLNHNKNNFCPIQLYLQ